MNIKEMHYDFKSKLNKIDSEKNRNLRIPEIDWSLNNAIDLLINTIAFPRKRSHLGFEINQRSIDDLRTLIVKDKSLQVINNEVILPLDYRHFISGNVTMSKGTCANVRGRLYIPQHDDEFEESFYDSSSFEWREVNGLIYQDKIKLFTNNFNIDGININYLRKPLKVYYGSGFNCYQTLDGVDHTDPLDPNKCIDVNCDLPEHLHSEIVDIAVMLSSQAIISPEFNIKSQSLQLRDLK